MVAYENDALVQMIFLFQEPPYSQVPAVSVSGVCLRFHQVALRSLDRDERFCAVRGLEQEAKVQWVFSTNVWILMDNP